MKRNCKLQIELRRPTTSRSQRNLQFAIASLLLTLIPLSTTINAEDKLPAVRHIFVRVNNPKEWPKGERELVPFDEYVKLREANQPVRPTRRGASIEWQSLSATFDPSRGVLTDGRWDAEVRSSQKKPLLLSLEPLDLPITDLKWADGEAVWGTAPSGETLLMVDSSERRLEGKFSRQGRRLQRTWQFDLQLPTATASELKLRVPAKYSLTCAAATIRGPLTSGEEGWRLWQLNLGGQSHCEVLIAESQTAAPTVPVIVYEQTSSYILREAEIEVQCEFNAEIFHTPKGTVEFVVPDNLSIDSIGFAGDSRLVWRELPRVPGQPRHLEVTLPEPQIGRVRALQLLGGVSTKWEPTLTLPRATLANGWFTSGRWNVSVDVPLVWRALKPVGLRLTEINATSPTTRRLSFTQFLADASLGIDITSPEARLTSHGLQRLTARETTWRLTSEWRWQSNTGVAFGARCRVPAGWEVLDVQSLPESAASEVRHWDVVKDAAGELVLGIDFVTPLEEQAAHRIQVVARRVRGLATERDSFELPTPLDCRHAEQLLIVQPPVGWRWDVASVEVVPAPTAIKRLGSPWLDFEMWKEDSPFWTATTLLNRSTQIDTPLHPLAVFVPDTTLPANPAASSVAVTPPIATGVPTADDAAAHGSTSFREAATEQLVWTSAELRSLIFPGGDGDDVHLLSLRAAQAARVGRLEFELPTPAELVFVRMNGVRAESQRNGNRFALPTIPLGGLQTLEIQYRVPSNHGFLRNRQSVPVPRVDAPVLGFRWLFALPPDARLAEEPSGLRLLQPLEPTPWSRRVFGPLGRDHSAMFNPVSNAAWLELWEPTVSSVRDENSLEPLFAPPGWRVREAVAATLPSEISWLSWSGVHVRVLAWIGMLLSVSVGCLLRVQRAQPRVHIAALWLGLCAVGVVLSAPVYAEVLGGCLVGAMIAALIPRRLLMSYSKQHEAAGRGAFEATVAFQRVVGAMFVSAVILSSAFAQELKSSGESANGQREVFDVLIPVDNPADATAEFVRPSEKTPVAYVPRELLQRWRERRAQRADPTSLMQSARYEMDWDKGAMQAEFVVHRLRPREPLTLRFPFVQIPLAGSNACLVDGQPRAVTVSEKRDSLLIELPPIEEVVPEAPAGTSADPIADQVSTHRVVFSLLPPIVTEDSSQRVKMNVPPVMLSHVVVKSSPSGEMEFPTARGERLGNAAAGAWTAQLGKLEERSLEIVRFSTARPRGTVELKADVSCLAELTPTALRQRYRVRYVASGGEVNEVIWLLPRGVLLRDGEVTADDLLQWSLEPLADGRQRLVVEFDEPQAGEFVVDVAGLQPPIGSTEQPHWQPWIVDASADDVTNTNTAANSTSIIKTKLRSFSLGVSSLPGFKVATPVEVDRIAPLSDSAFVKNWGTATLNRQPQISMQVLTPAELTFAVTPLAPQRKVRQELLLKVGRQAFEWALYAEVSTTGSPAFQHDVTLAPHFRADDVSVTEDEAERLVSWTQADQRLSLFLRDSTSGIQNIVLEGRDAVPADGRLPIPTHWFADAESVEFSLRVTHDPSWHVEVLDDQQLPLNPADAGGSIPDQPELVLGKFRADPKSVLLDVRLTPHQPAGRAAAWSQVTLNPGDSWSWRHIERLLDEGQITARIFWPAGWASSGSMKLSPALKELARRPLPDGIELTVQSLPDVAGPREVLFESQPAAPPADTAAAKTLVPMRLTQPTSLDVAERTHRWLIAEDLQTWLPPTLLTGLAPLDDASVLPDRLPRSPAAATKWLLVPSTSVLELTQPAPAGAPPSPKLLWMDTTVWVADGAITQGRTWLLLQPHGLREFELDRPEGMRWIAAFVNDRPRALSEETSQTALKLDELPNESLLWLSVYWQIDVAQRDRIVARRDTRLPMPADSSLRPPRHDLSLISSGHSELSSTRGARRVQDWDSQLARAESILRSLPTSPTAMNASLRRLWQLAESDLAEAQQTVERSSNVGQVSTLPATSPSKVDSQTGSVAHDSARERLQSVQAEAAVIRARLAPSLATSVATAPIESWTSDDWRQIPNSWAAIAEPDPAARLSVIVLNRRWLTWLAALLAALIVIPCFRAWLRWQTGEWLAARPSLAWACLGLIWWICLSPSLIGVGLLLVAAFTAIRQRGLNSSQVRSAN